MNANPRVGVGTFEGQAAGGAEEKRGGLVEPREIPKQKRRGRKKYVRRGQSFKRDPAGVKSGRGGLRRKRKVGNSNLHPEGVLPYLSQRETKEKTSGALQIRRDLVRQPLKRNQEGEKKRDILSEPETFIGGDRVK